MYTKKMHERIRKLTEVYYGFGLRDETGMFSFGKELTFADISELLDKIEDLELDVEYYKSECLRWALMEIELTNIEQRLIKTVAKERYKCARNNNVKNKKIGEQSNEITDLDGFGAELVVAKKLNLYPDLGVSPRSGGEDLITYKGKTIDVKQTSYKNGRLLATLKKGEERGGSDIFVLVTGVFPTYEIVGWCYRKELIKRENIKDLGHGLGYVLDQDKLRKFW